MAWRTLPAPRVSPFAQASTCEGRRIYRFLSRDCEHAITIGAARPTGCPEWAHSETTAVGRGGPLHERRPAAFEHKWRKAAQGGRPFSPGQSRLRHHRWLYYRSRRPRISMRSQLALLSCTVEAPYSPDHVEQECR